MLWILIIATVQGGIATAEFTTLERCEAAIVSARSAINGAYSSQLRWAICVER